MFVFNENYFIDDISGHFIFESIVLFTSHEFRLLHLLALNLVFNLFIRPYQLKPFPTFLSLPSLNYHLMTQRFALALLQFSYDLLLICICFSLVIFHHPLCCLCSYFLPQVLSSVFRFNMKHHDSILNTLQFIPGNVLQVFQWSLAAEVLAVEGGDDYFHEE